MAYASWSVVFGEQPSAAKWNILGTNDASFNDGTGIFGLYKNLLAVDSNPYKFRVYRNAALNTTSGSGTVLPFDTENFDTNNNVDTTTNKGRYTAPVAGFYQFSAAYTLTSSAGFVIIYLYKNGSQYAQGTNWLLTSASGASAIYSGIVQSAANDYWEIAYYVDGVRAFNVGATAGAYFSGHLVSRT